MRGARRKACSSKEKTRDAGFFVSGPALPWRSSDLTRLLLTRLTLTWPRSLLQEAREATPRICRRRGLSRTLSVMECLATGNVAFALHGRLPVTELPLEPLGRRGEELRVPCGPVLRLYPRRTGMPSGLSGAQPSPPGYGRCHCASLSALALSHRTASQCDSSRGGWAIRQPGVGAGVGESRS